MSQVTQSKRSYSLHKSRGILKGIYSWYKSKSNKLPPTDLAALEENMSALDQALLRNDRVEASELAHQLEKFSQANCKRSFLSYAWELLVALLFALVIATVVRQMWFELYEIPTGSMRPTFREQDHLTVTKTAFGLNFPLETRHLFFDPMLVQRSSVLIFSGDGLPISDVDTTFFGIFPYKKRYIKRLIGKPGDSIYFYGGRLYGVDREGNDITELRDSPWMHPLEYVPFLSFTGDVTANGTHSRLLRQMHKSYGKLTFQPSGQIIGEVFDGRTWVKDTPMAQAKPHDTIQTYSDIFGMRNYAEARLLTQEELKQLTPEIKDIPEGVLYLQLHHTPSLAYPNPIQGGNYLWITGYTTVIPLQQQHLDAIMDNLYTARFVVAKGKARRYSLDDKHFYPGSPQMPGVPDGTYEFYFGKATKINWGGIPTNVPNDSPLYRRDPENVQLLYNLGIDMDTSVAPKGANQFHFPHRYAYFRDGDLYLMGAPILKKDDPVLKAFNERETEREAKATLKAPYVAFKDYGAPIKEDGQIDVKFIRTFGATIPDGQYMVLGDNHAMSSDSRVFGFVPQNNLQGAPSWIIWPPGERLGPPAQKPYPFMNTPRAIVWGIAGLIALIWYAYHRWRIRQPIFVKRQS